MIPLQQDATSEYIKEGTDSSLNYDWRQVFFTYKLIAVAVEIPHMPLYNLKKKKYVTIVKRECVLEKTASLATITVAGMHRIEN
jgi:hypothetical protein